jgi:hypothetical protein
MVPTAAQGNCFSACAQADFRKMLPHVVRAGTARKIISIAELAMTSLSPTFDCSTTKEGARVLVSTADGDRGPVGAEIDRGEVVAHLRARTAAIRLVPEAEASGRSFPPALHAAAFENRASV